MLAWFLHELFQSIKYLDQTELYLHQNSNNKKAE